MSDPDRIWLQAYGQYSHARREDNSPSDEYIRADAVAEMIRQAVLAEREAWQPIDETTPRDGSLVLVAAIHATQWHNIFVAYWDDQIGTFKYHVEGHVRNPTHWKACPAPPSAIRARGVA